jgi:predicted phosphoribosyltransferase
MLADMFLYVDRVDAGEQLGVKLRDEPLIREVKLDELLVLSIPRGGVAVGAVVAQTLACAHDVVVVKKIGFPGREELAIGAMAEDGTIVLSQYVTNWPTLNDNYIEEKERQVKARIDAYIDRFRHGRTLDLRAKTAIVVDDGIATGETMKAAVTWLTSQDDDMCPRSVLVAVPVCSPFAARLFANLADKLVCLAVPQRFWAVGQFYWNFDQLGDQDVIDLLMKRSDQPTGQNNPIAS